ncbi:Ribokinase-like protein [Desarmillaria tabescens]|uniref:Ribokinase-like protein n=1 Tax=Armillaria tabescens TaxID=1929756 RepID=A0AA39KC68_ARMTA|nr:Ribokinase-like protein [Desarmillaria tabescens]KAK0457275.1 Ribokinase-like protein [Desarmillaria tabescens]
MASLTLATIGTILIDNIHHSDVTESHLGGGGLYAAVGARVWIPPETIGLSTGCSRSSVPQKFLKELDQFGEEMWIWDEKSKESMLETEIVYGAGTRSFRYLNPRPLLTVASLNAQSTRYLHFCCSPEDLSTSLAILSEPRPKIVYEPLPINCNPANLVTLKSVLPLIDVFSPNHEELELFLQEGRSSATNGGNIESLVSVYTEFGSKTIVVRAGARGCFITNKNPMLGTCTSRWLPPYWTAEEAKVNVRETTGAGNSFLGGLCAGMAMAGDDVFIGAAYGSVSASFVVQQPGLPSLSLGNEENWNGECPQQRLKRYFP